MLALLDARLKEVFFESQGNIPLIADAIVRTRPTERRYEIVSGVVGVPEADEVPEGGQFQSKQLGIRPNTIIEIKKFGFLMNVTRELIMDELFQPIADDVSRAMRNSMAQTKEHRTINMLNNSFTTQLVYDGLALFHTAHVLIQGGTQGNRPSTDSALDVDSLWEGINGMAATKDNSTLYSSIYTPKFISGHQNLQRRMNELIRSEWLPNIATAAAPSDNRENVLKQLYSLTPKNSPLFSSTTNWFLSADPSSVIDYGLVNYEREQLSIDALFSVKNDVELGAGVDRDLYSWRCRERYEVATVNWLGLWGNRGS